MRAYLAAPYAARDEVRQTYLYALDAARIECTSTWLHEAHKINDGTTGAATALSDAEAMGHAVQDLRDVSGSDALVLLTAKHCGCEGGGGRHVEVGYALAREIPVVVVGEPENVFHRLGAPRVWVEPSWELAVERLRYLRTQGRLP